MNIIILRGLPGSGKTHLVNTLIAKRDRPVIACSADDFFMQDGVYRFDPRLLAQAHNACLRKYIACLDAVPLHSIVVVDNTNTQTWEFQHYMDIANLIRLRERAVYVCHVPTALSDTELAARNTHGVPAPSIAVMRQRWERCPCEISPRELAFRLGVSLE